MRPDDGILGKDGTILPAGAQGPSGTISYAVGPTGPTGPLGPTVSEEMRNRIMADLETYRPPKAKPRVPLFSKLRVFVIKLRDGWQRFEHATEVWNRRVHGVGEVYAPEPKPQPVEEPYQGTPADVLKKRLEDLR